MKGIENALAIKWKKFYTCPILFKVWSHSNDEGGRKIKISLSLPCETFGKDSTKNLCLTTSACLSLYVHTISASSVWLSFWAGFPFQTRTKSLGYVNPKKNLYEYVMSMSRKICGANLNLLFWHTFVASSSSRQNIASGENVELCTRDSLLPLLLSWRKGSSLPSSQNLHRIALRMQYVRFALAVILTHNYAVMLMAHYCSRLATTLDEWLNMHNAASNSEEQLVQLLKNSNQIVMLDGGVLGRNDFTKKGDLMLQLVFQRAYNIYIDRCNSN